VVKAVAGEQSRVALWVREGSAVSMSVPLIFVCDFCCIWISLVPALSTTLHAVVAPVLPPASLLYVREIECYVFTTF